VSQFCNGIMIAAYQGDVFSCTERSQSNVRDTIDDRNLSSSRAWRTTYIVWTKNKSCYVGAKDQHAATRARGAGEAGDL